MDNFDKYLRVESRSFVILGDFQPSIYHPSWLQSKTIITEAEAETAKVDIITPKVCQFHIDDWLDFFVNRDRLQLVTRHQTQFEALVDFSVNILNAVTIIQATALGINNIFTVSLPDANSYYSIGKNMAAFNEWDDIVDSPRLNDISIKQKEDENNVIVNIGVSPTDPGQKINFGVDISINNHHALEKVDGKEVAKLIDRHSQLYFDKSKALSKAIITKFLK